MFKEIHCLHEKMQNIDEHHVCECPGDTRISKQKCKFISKLDETKCTHASREIVREAQGKAMKLRSVFRSIITVSLVTSLRHIFPYLLGSHPLIPTPTPPKRPHLYIFHLPQNDLVKSILTNDKSSNV